MKADLEAANGRVEALDRDIYKTPIDSHRDLNVDQFCLRFWGN